MRAAAGEEGAIEQITGECGGGAQRGAGRLLGGRVGLAHSAPPRRLPRSLRRRRQPACLPACLQRGLRDSEPPGVALPGSPPPASLPVLCAALPRRLGCKGLRPGADGAGAPRPDPAGWREAGWDFGAEGGEWREGGSSSRGNARRLHSLQKRCAPGVRRCAAAGEERAARGHPRGGDAVGPQATPPLSAVSNATSICLGYAAEIEPSDP